MSQIIYQVVVNRVCIGLQSSDAASEAPRAFGACPRATLSLNLRPVSQHLYVDDPPLCPWRLLRGILHLVDDTVASVQHIYASTAARSSYIDMLAECASNIMLPHLLRAKAEYDF